MQFTISQFKQSLRDTGALCLDPTEEISRFSDWTARFYLDDPGRHLSVEGNHYLARYVQNHVLSDRQNTASVKTVSD